ncbi:hypothetical protein NAPIS_ORF01057 [Vairimorpha apis BRL 01]|uniref:Uncharacterized protein n=1 Tax=Vairimorpha apis BRL 01 TaxID=1037528 RepID=T0MK29_9MICR|nr:hypothetical protein NAPIS_ORF01057 [Vairimorpha apis BRL 01]
MFIINCDIFVNKELENFLKEKKKNEKPEENSLREGLSRILSSSKLGDINPSTVSDTAYKQKISSSNLVPSGGGAAGGGSPGGGAAGGGASGGGASGGGSPGGGAAGGGSPGGGASGGGSKGGGSASGGSNGDKGKDDPDIKTIKVKDKDAALIQSEGNKDQPSVVVVADESILGNPEELKKLASEVGSAAGGESGGDKSKEGQGSSGGDTKSPGGGAKPPGGAGGGGAAAGGAKPPGGAGGGGAAAGGAKGSSLISSDITQESSFLNTTPDNLVEPVKKDKDLKSIESIENKKKTFWTTVLLDNSPKKVLINVKTITVLESLSNENLKEQIKDNKDKNIPSTFDFTKNKNSYEDDKKTEENKDDKKSDDQKKFKDSKKSDDKEEKNVKDKIKDNSSKITKDISKDDKKLNDKEENVKDKIKDNSSKITKDISKDDKN